jgi:hypothetical protein
MQGKNIDHSKNIDLQALGMYVLYACMYCINFIHDEDRVYGSTILSNK